MESYKVDHHYTILPVTVKEKQGKITPPADKSHTQRPVAGVTKPCVEPVSVISVQRVAAKLSGE
jgi:hypothetical protein